MGQRLSLSEDGDRNMFICKGAVRGLWGFVLCHVVNRGTLELKVDLSRHTDLQGNVK